MDREQYHDNWPEGSLEQFIWERCEADNKRVCEIMDRVDANTEELTEEVKKGMKQALFNEGLRKENEALNTWGEEWKTHYDRVLKENDRLKALVDCVEKILSSKVSLCLLLTRLRCLDEKDKQNLEMVFNSINESLAKIAEFKEEK